MSFIDIQHVLCFACLNAQINVVCQSGPRGSPARSRCSACFQVVFDVAPTLLETDRELKAAKEGQRTSRNEVEKSGESVVLRIDNVPWVSTGIWVDKFMRI